MITLTWHQLFTYFVGACVAFTSVCVAAGWLIRIIKAAKKPSDDVRKMLENDNKRLKMLEDSVAFMAKAISLLLQDDLAILNHLRTTNNTGEMAKQEEKVHEFLTEVKI